MRLPGYGGDALSPSPNLGYIISLISLHCLRKEYLSRRRFSDHTMSQARDLTGDTHKRFVSVTTLLALIDPVRGEPTVHNLDRHPHEGAGKQESLHKKFLDSFALICSTSSKGGESASAVCLEQGGPTGTVLRVASNLGVSQDVVDRIHLVLDDLTAVASGGMILKANFHLLTNFCSLFYKRKGV